MRLGFAIGSKQVDARPEVIYSRFEGCRRSVWEAEFLGPAVRQSRVENSVISIYYVVCNRGC